MSRNESFAEYVTEDVLGYIGGVSRKRLFSGHGVYLDGVIVGIIIDGTFYLKFNARTRAKYEILGSEPFKYSRPDGKIVEMPYMSVSIETLEDREVIKERVYESYEISKNKNTKKKHN